MRQAHRRPPADQPHPPGTTWAPPLQTVRRRHPAPVPGMHTGADPERPSRGPHHRSHPQDAASPGTGSTTPSGRTAHNTRSGGSPRPNCSFRRHTGGYLTAPARLRQLCRPRAASGQWLLCHLRGRIVRSDGRRDHDCRARALLQRVDKYSTVISACRSSRTPCSPKWRTQPSGTRETGSACGSR